MDRDMVSNRKQEIDRLVSCFGAGDLAQAEQIARRLLAADRQDEEALHLLAQICYRRGRAEESVTLMKELLGLNPAHAPYNNDYGVMLASLGRWDEAATAYGVAVVLDQRNVDARFNLALALFRTKQKDRARVELDRLMALRADLPEAVALNGELLRDEGRPTEAIEAFMQVIELGMETSDVYVNLGLALEDMNRGDEAAQALHKANRLDDGDAAACFDLGNFYRNTERPPGQRRALRRRCPKIPIWMPHTPIWEARAFAKGGWMEPSTASGVPSTSIRNPRKPGTILATFTSGCIDWERRRPPIDVRWISGRRTSRLT